MKLLSKKNEINITDMKYYIVENRKMPWGDYGNTLFEGRLLVMDENYQITEVHKIERTAPYIPEIYTTI